MLESLKTTIPGKRYEAVVPDTLDLADRAALAVNGLGGSIDPDLLTMYGNIHFACPRPHMLHWASADTLCDPKFAESFPLMRIMSGSEQYADLEAAFRTELLSRIDDGLYWDRVNPKRPWRNNYAPAFYGKGKDEDFATLPGAGRMLRALQVWRALGGGEECDHYLNELIGGLRRIAICRNDYCYYPEKGGWSEPCAYPRSGWLNTDEAESDTEGGEGAVTCMHGHQLYGAANWFALTGDLTALELATKLNHYCMLPKFWGGVPDPTADRTGLPGHIACPAPDPAFTAGAEQGHWYSHFHARAITLRGILAYGMATGDERTLEFVRRSYEFTLSQGIARIGWINCYPGAINHMEGCALGDLVALGIRLSDAGLGDYWDDVDAVTRNHLVEQQLINADLLERIADQHSEPCYCEKDPTPGFLTYDNVIQRSLGVFGGTSLPTSLPGAWVMHCCTGNATQGLYYAWEGILRENGDTAQINLLLNRAGRLLDIDSHLPYEGKIAIRNKAARRITVRIPAWVRRQQLRLQVNTVDRPLTWIGNYLLVDDLTPDDQLTLTFPMPEMTLSYTVNANSLVEQVYTCTFRGSTLVDISPRDESLTSYPFYQRELMRRGGPTPMKTAMRFVAERIVPNW